MFVAEVWPDISRNAAASRETMKSLGPLNSMELLERSEQSDKRLYRYRLTFKDTILIYTAVLTKEGKIAGLRLQPM